MKFPKRHLADSTLARVMIAARQTSAARSSSADALELVELPPLGNPAAAEQPQGNAEQFAQPPAELPPLDGSGLDAGLVMQGADSFDAMTKGISNGAG